MIDPEHSPSVSFELTKENLQHAFPGFEVIREVGAGAMGVVFEARDTRLGRRVAVKVLAPTTSSLDTRQVRFKREVEAIAKLDHPNIVPIYDVGQIGNLHYFVMGFVEGIGLDRMVDRDGPTNPERAVRLAKQVVEALQVAHKNGIIHRDVKPANILIEKDDRIFLTDFGLARQEGANTMTETGAIVGTPMYMAPEQILGDKDHIDGRCDLYSVGATLYELLTGERPFEAGATTAVLRRVLDKPPIPFHTHAARVPRELQKITLKLLSKSPRDRYGSTSALLADLDRFEQGIPVQASLPGTMTLFYRSMKKHRAMSLAFLAIVIAFIAFVVIDQLVDKKAAEQNAEQNKRALTKAEQLEALSRVEEEIEKVNRTWIRKGQISTAIATLEAVKDGHDLRLLVDGESRRVNAVELVYPYLSALHYYHGLVKGDERELDRALEIAEEGLKITPNLMSLRLQHTRVLMAQGDINALMGILAGFKATSEQDQTSELEAFFVEIRLRGLDFDKSKDRKQEVLAILKELDKLEKDSQGENYYLLRERVRALLSLTDLRYIGRFNGQTALQEARSLVIELQDYLRRDPHTRFLYSEIEHRIRGSRSMIDYIGEGADSLRSMGKDLMESGDTFNSLIDMFKPRKGGPKDDGE